MNGPFKLNEVKHKYTITWPTFHDIRGNESCYNLFNLLFDKFKLDCVQLLLNNDNMVTINASVWYEGDGAKQYAEWLMSQYNITGVVFDKKEYALELQEELEKRYMWKLLKT